MVMKKKNEYRGLDRVDRAVKKQLRGDDRGTDPDSARNKQLERQLKNQFGQTVKRSSGY